MKSSLRWLIAVAVLALVSQARADDAKSQPPAFFRSIVASAPPIITHLASVANGGRVLLFYDEGTMFPPEVVPNSAASLKSYVLSWNGTAWDAPRPFMHVSEALNVGGEIWALTNGGYVVSKDGVSWSQMSSQPNWKEPFGCVVAGRAHVFYVDDSTLRETSFDGMKWKEPHLITGDWKSSGGSFPFASGIQAVVISGRIHLFMLRRAGRTTQLLGMEYDGAGVGSPKAIGAAESFRLLEAPDGLHLFYKDMTPPAQVDKPTFTQALKMMFEMQSRMMRTSHRIHDGRTWSEPESILTGQAMPFAVARTDDALWLFGSAMSVIQQAVRRDGRWSPPNAVPGTNSAAQSRSISHYLNMIEMYVLLAVPLMTIFGLFVWGISSVIESMKTVDLELPGGSIHCASLFRRAGAQFVDGIVIWVAEMAIMLLLSGVGFSDSTTMMTRVGNHFFAMWASMMLLMTTLYLGYFAVCEARWGRTPGKRLFGIRVIADDGSPCSGRSAAIRNILRIVDIFPAYLIGVGAFALGKKHQRLGDMAARTLVMLDAKPS